MVFHGSTIVQLVIFHSKTTMFSSSLAPAKADPWGPRARRAADRTGQPGREAMVYL